MFALIVVFADVGGETCGGTFEHNGAISQAGYVFEQVGVFDGGCRGLAPGEGSVACDKDAGDGDGVEVLFAEKARDYHAGVEDVGFGDLCSGEEFGDWNGAVEVIGVGGA